ncbi:MAG: ATP-binding cassette domain-containing protein [Defluviitaleaceae bacterium]|nr:ATP-binding cassette domain-containing protein [Defluviitaleaceae bacterium]
MLEIKNVSIRHIVSDKMLVENFNFVLNHGDKAVIIGEEGNGKSTLLQFIFDKSLIDGYCEHDGQIATKAKMAYLPQFLTNDKLALPIQDFFGGINLKQYVKIFNSLGIDAELTTQSRPMSTLSGGEKIKMQLAKILMENPDILLLDEPTNDLDLETLDWIEDFINNCGLPIIFISHDETLIERTANVVIHIEQLVRKTKSKITIYHGGYAKYVKSRGLAYDKQMQVAKKQRTEHKVQMERWQQIHDKVEHQQNAISRGDPAGGRLLKKKMKAVKSAGRRMERQAEEFFDIPQMEEAILAGFDPKTHIPNGKVILDIPQLRVVGAARIGIVGKNGVGKTTLLRQMWNELKDRKDIIAVYMPQDYKEVLDYSQSVLDFLAPSGQKLDITKARTYLGGMKFTKDEMSGKIGSLSGGQKAKVLFLDMVFKNANVLVLDEPTRNFSPLSAPEIRRTLGEFGGAIISISHDRKYLQEVCGEVYELMSDGLLRQK